jgi:hypothetical protein
MQAAAMSLVSATTLMIGAAKNTLTNPGDRSGSVLVTRCVWLWAVGCGSVCSVCNLIATSCHVKSTRMGVVPHRYLSTSLTQPSVSFFCVVDLRRYRESVNTALHSLLVALKAARDAKLDGAKMM